MRLLILLTAQLSRAQLLSVDINKSQSPRPDDTAPGFVGWYDVGTGQTATHSFTNVTVVLDPNTGLPTATNFSVISCTLAQTIPAIGDTNSTLLANWLNKNGNTTSTDPNAGYRLCGDGVWVNDTSTGHPYTNGGALSLTISNLSAGLHTITTYHNDLWGTNAGQTWIHPASPFLSRSIVSANGIPVFTNVPSFFATNDNQCGFAFFTVSNSYDGQPVVLNFDPDHSGALDFVVLNGFEIDRPSAPGTTATAVFPPQNDEHVFASNDAPLPGTANAGYLTLQWLPAGFAVSNYLYLGTSSNIVANATITSPEFKTNNAALVYATNSFFVTNLDSALTYYWRVDQLDIENGATNLAKGKVWEFRTRHLAFPGAEGYGRWARGGRGGVVIEVTNLNDSGPGSYRAAIAASGPRTVVFRVSGLIRLQSPCVIGNGYLTIAGQTAPGDGICIANFRAGMSGPNDVIMRFMRFRIGDAEQQSMDAMSPGSATQTIVDHCSSSWSLDVACNSLQSGSVGSQSAMTTYQHNIISEPLRYSYHYNDAERAATGCTNCYQPHAFAASISGEIGSYHHNLIAHSTDRNWSLAGGLDQSAHYAGSLDIRNNVVYNWLARTTDGGVARLDYVNNYYKPYAPNSPVTWLLRLDSINTNWGTEYIYMNGNVMQGKSYYTNNWMSGSFVNGLPLAGLVVTNGELFPSYVTTQTASNAYEVVLSDVGCNEPAPDMIDQRIIGEVLDGTTHYEGTNGPTYTINGVLQDTAGPDNPGFIDSQTDVHDAAGSPNYPWPAYATADVPTDSDHDGLPDWWELAKGLNPDSAAGDFSDSNADPDGDGYTDLEDYLNWLAAPHLDCIRNAYVDVDLMRFTRGFTNNSPVYTVSNPTNGTVVLLAGGTIARFTPATGFYGTGGFQFEVTDASGFSCTNVVGVHVRANPQSHLTFSVSGGVPQLQFSGESGFYFLLQYSDDLAGWTTWTHTTATGSSQTFTPPGFPGLSVRFYRAVSAQ
ncbi:MAG TPA: Ig-like domain-containing protein [Verrucomicrobiae bacterium]|nr:Ig-like domain-containing protein [Verrucomicrobiae bacterium]